MKGGLFEVRWVVDYRDGGADGMGKGEDRAYKICNGKDK